MVNHNNISLKLHRYTPFASSLFELSFWDFIFQNSYIFKLHAFIVFLTTFYFDFCLARVMLALQWFGKFTIFLMCMEPFYILRAGKCFPITAWDRPLQENFLPTLIGWFWFSTSLKDSFGSTKPEVDTGQVSINRGMGDQTRGCHKVGDCLPIRRPKSWPTLRTETGLLQ